MRTNTNTRCENYRELFTKEYLMGPNSLRLLDEMLEKFTSKADNLNIIMDKMADSVGSITESVKQSSEAIGLSATNSTEIVGDIQGIDNAMSENNKVTETLNQRTSIFENL